MNKYIIATAVSLSVFSGSVNAMNGVPIDINVIVNNTAVEFDDQQPIILNDRTLLPLRKVMETLGKTVLWNEETAVTQITDGITTVSFQIGSDIMTKETYSDGLSISENIQLDQMPIIINGRTMLPIRAAAEAFGATVDWEASTSTVIITEGVSTNAE